MTARREARAGGHRVTADPVSASLDEALGNPDAAVWQSDRTALELARSAGLDVVLDLPSSLRDDCAERLRQVRQAYARTLGIDHAGPEARARGWYTRPRGLAWCEHCRERLGLRPPYRHTANPDQ